MTDDSNDGEEQSDSEQPDGSLSGIAGTLGTIHRVRQLVQETEDAEVSASSIKAMLGGYHAAEGTVTTYQDVASIAAKVGAAQSIQNSLTPAMAVLAKSDAMNYAGTAAALQQIGEQDGELSRNLSAISYFTQNTETIPSAIAAAARATDSGQPPDTLIADLATLRATKMHVASLSTHQIGGQLFDERDQTDHSPEDRRESTEPDNEIEEPTTTGPDKEAYTTYPNWEARIDESHIDATPSSRSAAQSDVEMPVKTLYKVVSEGETYQWLSSMAPSHRTAFIQMLLQTVAFAFGVSYPALADVLVDIVHGSVFESGDDEEQDET